MAWSTVYKLPWAQFDPARIEQAVDTVLGWLPLRPRDSELSFRNSFTIFWNVEFFPEEELQLSVMGDPEMLFRTHGIEDSDSLIVSIAFRSLPGIQSPQVWFEFDSSLAANRMMAGCGMHLAELLGRYFGVAGEVSD